MAPEVRTNYPDVLGPMGGEGQNWPFRFRVFLGPSAQKAGAEILTCYFQWIKLRRFALHGYGGHAEEINLSFFEHPSKSTSFLSEFARSRGHRAQGAGNATDDAMRGKVELLWLVYYCG